MKIVWESQGLRQQPDIFFIGETSELGPREQFTFYFSLLLFPEISVKFNIRPNGGSCRKCFLKFSFQTEPQVRQIWERHVCEGNNLYFVFIQKSFLRASVCGFESSLSEGKGPKNSNFHPLALLIERASLPFVVFGHVIAIFTRSVGRISYKRHSTRFDVIPHGYFQVSWMCDKNCGRRSRDETFWQKN